METPGLEDTSSEVVTTDFDTSDSDNSKQTSSQSRSNSGPCPWTSSTANSGQGYYSTLTSG